MPNALASGLTAIILLALLTPGLPTSAGANTGASGDGDLSLKRTDPDHLSEPRKTVTTPPRSPAWGDREAGDGAVIYRFTVPITDMDPAITPDLRLSRLCRTGLFGQILSKRLRAVDQDGRVFDLAFGSKGARANLFDPMDLALADWMYLFDDHDTSRCQVWAGSVAAARSFASLDENGRPTAPRP